MPFSAVARLPEPLPFDLHPPVARHTQSPRLLRPVAQPPSPESKPGLSANRPRCLSASHRLPGAGVARSLPSVARPPLPRRSPGLSANRPRRPLDAVHADPVNRVIVRRRRTSSEFAVGVLARSPPGHLSARGPRLPGDSVLRSMWLLAPTGTALASWIGSVLRSACPEGRTSQTRSLDPGLRALSGTRDTFAPGKPQVKRYFRIPRVIHQTSLEIPRNSRFIHCSYTTSCTGLSPAQPALVHPKARRRAGDDRVDVASRIDD